MHQLEKLLRAVQPDLNVEEVVPKTSDLAQHHLTCVFPSQEALSESREPDHIPTRAATPDSVPAGSRGFDWNIQQTENGENAASGEPNPVPGGVGYLGSLLIFRVMPLLNGCKPRQIHKCCSAPYLAQDRLAVEERAGAATAA